MNIGSGRSVAVIAKETVKERFGQNLGQRYAQIGSNRLENAYNYSNLMLKHAQNLKQNSTIETIANTIKSLFSLSENTDKFHQQIRSAKRIKNKAHKTNQEISPLTQLSHDTIASKCEENSEKVLQIQKEILNSLLSIQKATK